MYVCMQHHRDVYGLSISSSCPWLLVLASRDSTLRFWDLRGLAAGGRQDHLLKCAAHGKTGYPVQYQTVHCVCGCANSKRTACPANPALVRAGVLFCARPPDHVPPDGGGAAWAGRVGCGPC